MDVLNEINMSYQEYVDFLIGKYGKSKYDYFCDETCKRRNQKGVRIEKGLFQHHIDENKAILLSTPEYAIQQPFEYQRSDRLVYCNFLEHFLLHIKIVEERKDLMVGIGGADMIMRTLNDAFYKNKPNLKWQRKCFENIKENYTDYLLLLSYFHHIVRQDKILTKEFSDRDFARGWSGNVVRSVYYDLKDIIQNFDKF